MASPWARRRRGVFAALALALSIGCAGARVKLETPDRVEAGLPLVFRADELLEWHFGDGTESVEGDEVTHVFARAGEYRVRALRGKVQVYARDLEVVPRAVWRAIPPQAQAALYIPTVRGRMERIVDFGERLLGISGAERALESQPLLALAAESAAGGAGALPVVDIDEGAGVFTLASVRGPIGLLGVTDDVAGLEAALARLEGLGGAARADESGAVRIRLTSGSEVALLTDRGYLYLAGSAEEGAGPLTREELTAFVELVRGADSRGLERMRMPSEEHPRAGDAWAYLAPATQDRPPLLLGAMRFAPGSAQLSAFVDAGVGPLPLSKLSRSLRQTPGQPVAALWLPAAPDALLTWALGLPSNRWRERWAQRWPLLLAIEQLRGAVSGLGLALYFDAAEFLEQLAQGKPHPFPTGALVIEAAVRDAEALRRWVADQLAAAEVALEVDRQGEITRYRWRWDDLPVVMELSQDRARVRLGELPEHKEVDLLAALRKRFAGAFADDHLSAMFDFGRARGQLADTLALPGVNASRLGLLRGMAGSFFRQLVPVDLAVVDLAEEAEGTRLRAEVRVARQ